MINEQLMQNYSKLRIIVKNLFEVEDSLLSTNIFSIFKRKDYDSYRSNILVLTKNLEFLELEIKNEDNSSALIELIDAIKFYINSLSRINDGLEKKSLAQPYSHTEYKRDLKSIDEAREFCAKAQEKIFLHN